MNKNFVFYPWYQEFSIDQKINFKSHIMNLRSQMENYLRRVHPMTMSDYERFLREKALRSIEIEIVTEI